MSKDVYICSSNRFNLVVEAMASRRSKLHLYVLKCSHESTRNFVPHGYTIFALFATSVSEWV